ncbi:hypothetical protein NOR_03862 [Metarhizium rileyi]|uniref:Uncharacterized protein n=1 Tax=Metarhizium rileyi (strain RCEF 4871) TaxID=1649241 RepID=A0A167ELY6_METRR|nr:hypothetical protein NOR_03862 [Metarhizium rileyi RCEF 4871]
MTWPDYYAKPEPGMEKVDRAHIDHCIEMLRIAIMCAGDVTPITLYIPEWQDDPTPDFSTMHTCRDFNKILDYVKQNEIEWSYSSNE